MTKGVSVLFYMQDDIIRRVGIQCPAELKNRRRCLVEEKAQRGISGQDGGRIRAITAASILARPLANHVIIGRGPPVNDSMVPEETCNNSVIRLYLIIDAN